MSVVSTAGPHWNLYMAQKQVSFFQGRSLAEGILKDNRVRSRPAKVRSQVLEAEAGVALQIPPRPSQEKLIEAANRLRALYATPFATNNLVSPWMSRGEEVPVDAFESWRSAYETTDYLIQQKSSASKTCASATRRTSA